MASGTAISRLLGLVRNALLVGAIGTTGLAANAFDVANRIPNFAFAIIAGGVLNAVLVPQIVRAYKAHNTQERLDKLLTLSAIILLVLTSALTSCAVLLIALYSNDEFTPAQEALAVSFALWCIPQLFFYGLYTLLGQVLNARKQFGPFMWAPALNNVISIIGFSIFIVIYGGARGVNPHGMDTWDSTKVALLAGTATLGVAGQALILLVPLWRSGFRWHLQLGLRGIGLRSAGRVALWTMGAAVLEQVGVVVITRIATAAPSADPHSTIAGAAVYTQALMLYLLPHSLVTVSIATALFTGMSAAAEAGDTDAVRADLSRGLRIIGVFTVLATALMVVLATPITKLIVPTMSAAENVAVGQVLAAMSWGLVPLGAMVLMKWVYFAFEDGGTVFRMQIPTTAVLIVVSLAFSYFTEPQWWVAGIGIAMSIANVVTVVGRSIGLRRTLHGLDGSRILRMYLRAGLSAAVASLVGWGVLSIFGSEPTTALWSLTWTIVVGLIMTAIYVAGLRLMRVREFDALIRPLTRRLGARRAR